MAPDASFCWTASTSLRLSLWGMMGTLLLSLRSAPQRSISTTSRMQSHQHMLDFAKHI
jgi:hypothetical protein